MAFGWQSALAESIAAIGTDDFVTTAAGALRRAADFDLTAVVLHRGTAEASLLFDDFGPAGHAEGIGNYVRFTHRMNPMLNPAPTYGALRARDFALRPRRGANRVPHHLVWSSDEEMGFRTCGWPERCEEIGLYVPACGGTIELGFYRQRGRHRFPDDDLAALSHLALPLAAAFDRHAAARGQPTADARLSIRERDVHALMMKGCSSEAIALRLGISRHTVKDHRKRIFRKFGISSLAELFALNQPT